jgi:aldose 1-epimerase
MLKQGFMRGMVLSVFALASASAGAVEAKKVDFGKLADGTPIEAVELSNAHGVSARIMNLGAILQSLKVPGSDGKAADVVLGYATPAEYLAKPQYFGASVGRYANRIRNGQFTIDGKQYQLARNDGPNALHGGKRGFDKAVWKIESVKSGEVASVTLSHVSPDGDEGYPGKLSVTAIYSLNDNNELRLEYHATTDKPTVLNITNHSYFNLAGEGNDDIMSQKLTIMADAYTPVDKTLIPTGERRNVAGTPFDFRQPVAIGERIRDGRDEQMQIGRGYDHNYVLRGPAGSVRPAVRLEDPHSGRVMELLTAAPGVQFYSGNFLDATVTGKSGHIYRQGDGLCLEPQVFPDSPNHPDFPSARLNPGQTYSNIIVYRFSTVRH